MRANADVHFLSEDDENILKLILVMDAQLSEFTKNTTVYLKRVYSMVGELYFNTIIKEKKSRY